MKMVNDSASVHTSLPQPRTGRWTLDEKLLFLYGLQKFGKGRWKKISVYLPNRSLIQIKSHGQKVLKRLDEGESIFQRLFENQLHVEKLVNDLQVQLGSDPASLEMPKKRRRVSQATASVPDELAKTAATTATAVSTALVTSESIATAATMNTSLFSFHDVQEQQTRQQAELLNDLLLKSSEHIIAASALCQLSAPKRMLRTVVENNKLSTNASNTFYTMESPNKSKAIDIDRSSSSPSSTLWGGLSLI